LFVVAARSLGNIKHIHIAAPATRHTGCLSLAFSFFLAAGERGWELFSFAAWVAAMHPGERE